MAKSKSPVDQVNIWYSPNIDKWVVCALLVEGQLLRREKEVYSSLEEAMAEAAKRYKSRAKNNF